MFGANFDGKNCYVIDALNVSNELLRAFFVSPNLKIIYESSSDKRLILKQFGVDLNCVFDLRILAHTLEIFGGLNGALSHFLGITIPAKKKFQKHDWTKRPILPEALKYAINDVLHLFLLKDKMLSALKFTKKQGAIISQIIRANAPEKTSEKTPEQIANGTGLNAKNRAKFLAIYILADKAARRADIPMHFIISKKQILGLIGGKISVNELKIPRRVEFVFANFKKRIQNELNR